MFPRRPPGRAAGRYGSNVNPPRDLETAMSAPAWTDEELADLEETITAARDVGNSELAAYWQGIRDGSTPTRAWEDLRVELYAKDGIDVSGQAA